MPKCGAAGPGRQVAVDAVRDASASEGLGAAGASPPLVSGRPVIEHGGPAGGLARLCKIRGGCQVSVDVSTEIDIAREIAVVAEYAADPANAPEWYQNIRSVEWRTDPPLRVGSVVGFVARFLGRTLAYDYEIVAFEPDARLVMRTAQGPFPMETTYTWAPSAAGTRMTLRNRGEPAGFSKLLAPLMAPAMRRTNTKDLARLKAIVESR